MQVVRYFHIRPHSGLKSKFNGATVRVAGNTTDPAQVDVQVTFCSRKDMYCKATGRLHAQAAKVKIIPLRYLPNELARIEEATTGLNIANMWLFAIRYFLPKE